jgi:hypothetical protein
VDEPLRALNGDEYQNRLYFGMFLTFREVPLVNARRGAAQHTSNVRYCFPLLNRSSSSDRSSGSLPIYLFLLSNARRRRDPRWLFEVVVFVPRIWLALRLLCRSSFPCDCH